MTEYDGRVIEEYARKLYDRIGWIIVMTIFVYAGLAVLAVFAWVKLAELVGSGRGVPVEPPGTWYILAAAAGALIGALRGNGKAFDRKLEAQRALCLLQIERNTRVKPGENDGVMSRPDEGSARPDVSAGEEARDVAPADQHIPLRS